MELKQLGLSITATQRKTELFIIYITICSTYSKISFTENYKIGLSQLLIIKRKQWERTDVELNTSNRHIKSCFHELLNILLDWWWKEIQVSCSPLYFVVNVISLIESPHACSRNLVFLPSASFTCDLKISCSTNPRRHAMFLLSQDETYVRMSGSWELIIRHLITSWSKYNTLNHICVQSLYHT